MDYQLDYGRLAYTKADELQRKFNSLENILLKNKQASLEFAENEYGILGISENRFSYNFNVLKNTSVNIDLSITAESQTECKTKIILYVNGVYVNALRFTANSGAHIYNFRENLPLLLSGFSKISLNICMDENENAQNFALKLKNLRVSLSGNYIDYINEKYSMKQRGDYAALLSQNKISFYFITGNSPERLSNAELPACKNFDFIHFLPNIIALFRLTENNGLICDVYAVSTSGRFIKKDSFCVLKNVQDLCCAAGNNCAKLYAASGNKLYIYDINCIGNAVSAVKTDVEVSDTTAVSAIIEKNQTHMLLGDLKKQRFYAYTDKEAQPGTDNFKLNFKFLSRWNVYN